MRLPLVGHMSGRVAVPALLVVMAGAGYAVVHTTGLSRARPSRVSDAAPGTVVSPSPLATVTKVTPIMKRIPLAPGAAPELDAYEIADAIGSAPLPDLGFEPIAGPRDATRRAGQSFMSGGIGIHPRSSSSGSGGFGSSGFGFGPIGGGVSGTMSPNARTRTAAPALTPGSRVRSARANPSTPTPARTGNAVQQAPAAPSAAPTQAATLASAAALAPIVPGSPGPALAAQAVTGNGAPPLGASASSPSPSPTPEPLSLFLVGAGVIGLWSVRRTLR